MTKPLYAISHDGQGSGGFLSPPGHWNLEYTLKGYWNGRRKNDPDMIGSIEYALTDESDASESIRERVRAIMANAVLTDSDMWERGIYGYFRNSYSPDGTDRNVSRAVSTGEPDHHLAVLCIRKCFPDHQPRLDLIADPGKSYGSYPCVKCGKRVQYEARADALTVFPSRDPQCPEGGRHEW